MVGVAANLSGSIHLLNSRGAMITLEQKDLVEVREKRL